MPYVFVVGSINLDFICKGQRVPANGETLIMDSLHTASGGKGLNQAICLRKQGCNVFFAGCVGTDTYGAQLEQTLVAHRLPYYLKKDESLCTGMVFIGIDAEGQNTMMVCPGANLALRSGDISDEMLENCDMFVAQQEISLPVLEELFKRAKQLGKKTLLNAAPASSYKVAPDLVDFLVVNEQEFQYLLGESIPQDQEPVFLPRLVDRGYRRVILTCGSRGAYYMEEKDLLFHPAFKVKAINTVGAGDTFIGAWIYAHLEGQSAQNALKYASAAGALAVQKDISAEGTPSHEEILGFLHNSQD